MSLRLYFHPLAAFCHKVLIALYENDTPFEPHIVDLGNESLRAEFVKIWPIGKFPVLRDEAADWMVPESSTIIEYLAQHYPGRTALVPADADLARQSRMRDRFYDLYVNVPMQKIGVERSGGACSATAWRGRSAISPAKLSVRTPPCFRATRCPRRSSRNSVRAGSSRRSS